MSYYDKHVKASSFPLVFLHYLNHICFLDTKNCFGRVFLDVMQVKVKSWLITSSCLGTPLVREDLIGHNEQVAPLFQSQHSAVMNCWKGQVVSDCKIISHFMYSQLRTKECFTFSLWSIMSLFSVVHYVSGCNSILFGWDSRKDFYSWARIWYSGKCNNHGCPRVLEWTISICHSQSQLS